jgi:general secretion pathway protein K
VALITALVVVAIAAGIAAAMIWETGLDTRRTETLTQGDQAMEYALGAESWAEQILARSMRQNKNVAALGQDWAQQLPPLPVEGGQILGKIEDLQGRFNINNVSTTTGNTQFQNLLTALGQDPALAASVAAWMATGPGGSAIGAGDDQYTRLQPPYLSGQRPMASISELQLVAGFTPAVYAQVSPYLCALPIQGGIPTPININTASAPVIQSLNDHLTPDQASQVIGERGNAGLRSPPAAFQPYKISPGSYGYNSNYFLVTVVAQIGTTHVTLYSLLQNTGGQFSVIRRTFGTL